MSNLSVSAVSTSKFVRITPQVEAAVSSAFSLTGLVLTKNGRLPFCQPYIFYSTDAVKSYFGSTSEEAIFAKDYFNANSGKTKLPAYIIFSAYSDGAVPAWLRGAEVRTPVTSLAEITDGAMKLSIGGVEVSLTGISFDGLTSYSAIAGAVQTALRAAGDTAVFTSATVEYVSAAKAFQITLGSTAGTATISYASSPDQGTDIAAALRLREMDGAIISLPCNEALAPEEYMDRLVNQTKSFFSFTRLWTLESDTDRVSEDLAFSKWTAEQGVRFCFVEYDMSSVDLNPNSYADFASNLSAAGYGGTICNYGTSALAAFVMGTLAAINYDTPNGRITLAYKSGEATEVTCDNDQDFDALNGKEYNCYVRDASAANNFLGYQTGCISGDYKFADSYANHVWLNDRLQVSIRSALGSANALPYTEASYGRLLGAIKGDLDQAISAGVINIGVDAPDENSLAEIAADTGYEISTIRTSLYTAGWLFYAKSPSASARAQRESPILKLYFVDGGAIQKVDLTSTALL